MGRIIASAPCLFVIYGVFDMMYKKETVKVVHDSKDGFMVINKEDFDPKVHKVYKEKKRKEDKKAE